LLGISVHFVKRTKKSNCRDLKKTFPQKKRIQNSIRQISPPKQTENKPRQIILKIKIAKKVVSIGIEKKLVVVIGKCKILFRNNLKMHRKPTTIERFEHFEQIYKRIFDSSSKAND
jgi:hypothetical protein